MDETQLGRWVEGYVQAWNSNDPAEIADLFAEDGTYRTEPYALPWRGRQAIVDGWLAHRDEPGQATFRWHPVVVADEVAVVEGRTEYRTDPPRNYRNIWVIRLDGRGRCTEFTEWWMTEPADVVTTPPAPRAGRG
jgi:uncharacterized protein (TIGR02246 family)